MPDKPKEKEKNQSYFEMFLKDYYPTPDGTIRYGDKPDVILEGERKIGIEITNLYLEEGGDPQSPQVQRKRREQVVSEAQQIYQKGDGKKFRMYLVFSESNPIWDKKKVIKGIVELARDFENYLETGQDREFILRRNKDSFEIDRDYSAIPELFLVYIDLVDAEWSVDRSYNRELMSMERLRKRIKEKEDKLPRYERCDSYWLLVVVDNWDPPQDQETRIDNCEKVESEGFEKIFVCSTFGDILEVK